MCGGGSDYIFEAVGGVAGQLRALAATTQVLAVGPLHVNVPLLLLTDATSLRATLRPRGEDTLNEEAVKECF